MLQTGKDNRRSLHLPPSSLTFRLRIFKKVHSAIFLPRTARALATIGTAREYRREKFITPMQRRRTHHQNLDAANALPQSGYCKKFFG
jgi:hypothetical protein